MKGKYPIGFSACMLLTAGAANAQATLEALSVSSSSYVLNEPVGGVAKAGDVEAVPSTTKPSLPIGSLTAGYGYLNADQGNGTHSHLNGWLVKPTFNLPHGWAVYLDASNYYGRNARASINLHTYSIGVSKEVFAKPKLKPALFVQMGDSRNSNAGKVVNAYAFLTGVSFTTPLRPWVSLSVIPAEYVFTYPEGDPRNSFNAKVSLVFPLGHKKKS